MLNKPVIRFKGAVENGKLIMLNEDIWERHLKSLKGEVFITCETKKRNRTLPQNALYWLWLSYLQDETGQPKEDFHDYFKKKYLIRIVELKNKEGKKITEKVVGSTSTLNSFDFTQYLENVQMEAAQYFGVNLPSPDDLYV